MKRRAFISSVTLGLLAAPLAAGAQQAGTARRVGVLLSGRLDPGGLVVAFQQGMRDLGYTADQNVRYEERRGPIERLPDLAAELVKLNVEVIVAWGTAGIAAAKRATTSIPIVMASSGDAVVTGLVASLARPGG